jgi:hypothetical protein
MTPVLIVDTVALFLYCLGWTYIYFLYYQFGIIVHALDIPVYYFFIYAYPVIAGNVLWFGAVAVIIILFSIFLRKWAGHLRKRFKQFPKDEQLIRCAVAVYLITLFPLCFYLARKSAEESAADMRSGNAKTIQFVFKEDKPFPPDFIAANSANRLKLLTQTPTTFIVFLQPETEEKVLPYGSTYVVFNSDIHLVTIRMGNVPKKE